jgi:hypothetical protein
MGYLLGESFVFADHPALSPAAAQLGGDPAILYTSLLAWMNQARNDQAKYCSLDLSSNFTLETVREVVSMLE